MRLSGSRVDLILACGYAFNGQKWPRDESGDAARIGNAVHYVAAKSINGSDAPLVTLVADALASVKGPQEETQPAKRNPQINAPIPCKDNGEGPTLFKASGLFRLQSA